MASVRRLYRSKQNGMLGGVSAGLADYFDVDVTIVRIGWIALAFVTAGFALVLYLAMWILVPEKEGEASPQGNSLGIVGVTGVVLVAGGIVLLFTQLGVFGWWVWPILAPVALIGGGILLLKRTRA